MGANIWNPGTGVIIANAENGSLIQKFVATAGQTVFELTAFGYVVNTGSIRVYRNGQKLQQSEVTEDDGNQFSLVGIVLAAGEIIECSAVLGSQDAVTAAALSAAESAKEAYLVLENSIKQTSPTGSALMPVGTTAERDVSPTYGAERTNSDTNEKEWWNGTSWVALVSDPSTFATKASPTFTGPVTLPQIINVTQPYGEVLIAGVPAMRIGGANGDNSGQLAGFRNILLNPRVSRGINQRGVANWAAVAIGAYGYDRWKKVDNSNILQIIEAGNYVPSAVYTLSGDNVVTGQITAPASGHWTLPAIPNTADNVQLEKGHIATDRENRLSLELMFCLRYFAAYGGTANLPIMDCAYSSSGGGQAYIKHIVPMRASPTAEFVGAIDAMDNALGPVSVNVALSTSSPQVSVFSVTGGALTTQAPHLYRCRDATTFIFLSTEL